MEKLRQIANGMDAGTFRSLFVTFSPKIKKMLLQQGADIETAEDIAQETMIAIWRKSHLVATEKGDISSWIYSVARSLRIDHAHRQRLLRRYYDEFEGTDWPAPATEAALPFEHPRDEIEKALGTLPPEQLQVIQLSFIDGLSQSEIAARLDLPLGTVKSRFRLAYEKLRRATEGDDAATSEPKPIEKKEKSRFGLLFEKVCGSIGGRHQGAASPADVPLEMPASQLLQFVDWLFEELATTPDDALMANCSRGDADKAVSELRSAAAYAQWLARAKERERAIAEERGQSARNTSLNKIVK